MSILLHKDWRKWCVVIHTTEPGGLSAGVTWDGWMMLAATVNLGVLPVLRRWREVFQPAPSRHVRCPEPISVSQLDEEDNHE